MLTVVGSVGRYVVICIGGVIGGGVVVVGAYVGCTRVGWPVSLRG